MRTRRNGHSEHLVEADLVCGEGFGTKTWLQRQENAEYVRSMNDSQRYSNQIQNEQSIKCTKICIKNARNQVVKVESKSIQTTYKTKRRKRKNDWGFSVYAAVGHLVCGCCCYTRTWTRCIAIARWISRCTSSFGQRIVARCAWHWFRWRLTATCRIGVQCRRWGCLLAAASGVLCGRLLLIDLQLLLLLLLVFLLWIGFIFRFKFAYQLALCETARLLLLLLAAAAAVVLIAILLLAALAQHHKVLVVIPLGRHGLLVLILILIWIDCLSLCLLVLNMLWVVAIDLHIGMCVYVCIVCVYLDSMRIIKEVEFIINTAPAPQSH